MRLPPRVDEPEMLDGPLLDPLLLAENLRDLGAVNRWLGGAWLVEWGAARLWEGAPPGSPLSLLDVACGGADIPRALARRAARRGRDLRVAACDLRPQIARQAAATGAPITLLAADGRFLPFADASFDIVTCSLALHHFDEAGAVALLRELGRVARRGVVLDDIVRSRAGYAGAWLITRLISRNPLTRHDGPLSVRRAFSPGELAACLRRAGLHPLARRVIPGYRAIFAASAYSRP